ncbi:hypothetical protein [Lichenifustis flavocetrariae]|uniref:DUF3618 domain-containing protein n=1 Tax=Lichenifustis flavocetrariae TaxID=2949735 RepID=A0AA41YY82_9HYPH|nr:hypothetical protein [Lichenifustis flavocetrariae]MCW6509461.1 hypothetical protein [Lichenifustis flavocetrariae]
MSLFTDQTSAEVAEEAENERAGLVNTLDQLRENLKPSNVVDEVMAHATFDSTALMDRVWQTARANPIPAVLIGLGAAMLLGFGRLSTPNSTKGRASTRVSVRGNVPPTVNYGATNRGEATAARSDSGSPDISTRTRTTRTSTEMNNLRNANLGYGRASTSADLRQPVRPLMNTSLNLKHPTSSLARLFDEQPLVLAALGVAVGAAVGAALPSTDVEAQLMGDASESMRQSAAAAARQQLSQLKATADQTFDQVKSTVAEHGVSTDNLSDLVHDIGGQVKSATYSAAHQAADSLPRHS